MSTKPGIFEPMKQPGKVVNSFTSVPKPLIQNFQPTERTTSPFRGYKNDGKILALSGATKETSGENTEVLSSYRSNTSESDTKSQSGPQTHESMRDFKNLLANWKNEIFDEVRNSMNECNSKIQRNKETLDMIKQHLKVNTQSINEIDTKFLDYETKLIGLETLITSQSKSFIDAQEAATKQTSSKEQTNPEQNLISTTLSKYVQLTEGLSQDFEKYKNDLSQTIETQLLMFREQFDGRIDIIENEIAAGVKSSEADEMQRLKSEIDKGFQASNQSFNEQLSALQRMLDSFAKETQSKLTANSQASAKNSFAEDFLIHVSKTDRNLKEIQEYFENRTNALEDKLHEQLEKFDSELRICSDEIQTLTNKYETSKFDSNMTLLVKFNSLNKDFEELAVTQKKMQFDFANINQSLEESKLITSSSVADLQVKLSASSSTEIQVKKLEGQVESLQNVVDSLKQNSPSKISNVYTAFDAKSSWASAEKYKTESIGAKSTGQQYLATETTISKKEESPNRAPGQTLNQYSNFNSDYSSPENLSVGGERRAEDVKPYERSYYQNKNLLNGSPEGNGHNSAFSLEIGNYEGKKPSSLEKRSSLKTSQILTPESIIPEVRFTDGGYIVQEKKPDLSIQAAAYTPDTIEKKRSESQITNHKSPTLQRYQEDELRSRSSDKPSPTLLKSPTGLIISPKFNLNTQKFSSPQELPNQTEEEEEQEFVFQFDENGFLLDEDGNYILDEHNQMIKLDKEHIERLRASNLLQESP